jgi:LytS/YehU family sensor histidine kinase
MRISDGFDYILIIDETLDMDNIEVPPLFLQPFVENAIWHGLANNKGKKKIKLQIYNEGKNIRCELTDNGIGINKTMNDKNYLKGDRKSFGVKATEDRIKLLHKNAKVYLIIEDISNTKTTGTKVTLKFPKHI